jgi:hypothetical protein
MNFICQVFYLRVNEKLTTFSKIKNSRHDQDDKKPHSIKQPAEHENDQEAKHQKTKNLIAEWERPAHPTPFGENKQHHNSIRMMGEKVVFFFLLIRSRIGELPWSGSASERVMGRKGRR